LNREVKEVCKKEKMEGLIKITKETEDENATHSARKDEDDTGTACGLNDREILTRAEEESNKEAKETGKKHELETLVKTIRDVQKEEAFILKLMRNRDESKPLRSAPKRSTRVWMWVLRRLGYVWVGGGWEGVRMVELEEEDENIMTD
jgi:hypothetical protein